MNKTTIGSSLIFVAEHCAWPLRRYDEKHPLSHSMICGLLVSLFSANVSNSKIHIPQSLLLFSAYHLQSQIVYWISNIGLSGSQYAGKRRGRGGMFRKWSKMRWKWRSVARFDCYRWEPGVDGTIWLFTEVMNPAKNASNSTLDRIMFG